MPVFEVPPLSQVTDAQQLLSLVASVQAPTRVHGQEGTQVAARLVCTHLYLPTAVTKVLNLLVPVSMCCNSAERHLFNNTMTLKPVEAGNHGLLHLFSWRKYGILRQPSVRSHKWLLKMWRAVDWLVKSVLQERGQPIPVAR